MMRNRPVALDLDRSTDLLGCILYPCLLQASILETCQLSLSHSRLAKVGGFLGCAHYTHDSVSRTRSFFLCFLTPSPSSP